MQALNIPLGYDNPVMLLPIGWALEVNGYDVIRVPGKRQLLDGNHFFRKGPLKENLRDPQVNPSWKRVNFLGRNEAFQWHPISKLLFTETTRIYI